MPRLNQLSQVLFPVEELPVFVAVGGESGGSQVVVPGKKAIVNTSSHRVLGIVSRSYRLVTNQQALEWAYHCCRAVFPSTAPSEWQVKATDAPGTAGYCHIDLLHNSTVLDFSFVPAEDRPEVFGPFIRVTNSYNGMRALAFDIGFYRKVCKNGLILPNSIIRFKFTHQRREIGTDIQFDVALGEVQKLSRSFGVYMSALRNCPIPESQFGSLVCAVLGLRRRRPAKPGTEEDEEWTALQTHLGKMSDGYAQALGENAYAVLNVATEFASQPPANRYVQRDKHSLQRLAGAWLHSFSQECVRPGFELAGYLECAARAPQPVAAAPGRQA